MTNGAANIALTRVSVRGRTQLVPSLSLDECSVIVKGRHLQIAEVFDEYWLPARSLPEPEIVLATCEAMRPRPDLYTFAQRVPHTEPKHPFLRAWENIAAIPLTTYDEWLAKQVSSATRRNIRNAEKRGVTVTAAAYDDAYVNGIMGIYNESRIRQGRRFWHYGKDFASVYAENGTYADRSTYLAAYHAGEMIGYAKVVWDEETAAIMQIMSRLQHYDKRPNNALMAAAVRAACERGVKHLLYEAYVYANKSDSSLTEFKRSNGFVRVDLPRYYVPLTWKGAVALRLGLHRPFRDRVPNRLASAWVEIRSRWYARTR